MVGNPAQSAPSTQQLKKLLKVYSKTLRQRPDDLDLRTKLAEVLRLLDRKDEAIALYSSVAWAYGVAGNLGQAVILCKIILGLNPNHSETQQMLAKLYASKEIRKQKQSVPVIKVDGKWIADPRGTKAKKLLGNHQDAGIQAPGIHRRRARLESEDDTPPPIPIEEIFSQEVAAEDILSSQSAEAPFPVGPADRQPATARAKETRERQPPPCSIDREHAEAAKPAVRLSPRPAASRQPPDDPPCAEVATACDLPSMKVEKRRQSGQIDYRAEEDREDGRTPTGEEAKPTPLQALETSAGRQLARSRSMPPPGDPVPSREWVAHAPTWEADPDRIAPEGHPPVVVTTNAEGQLRFDPSASHREDPGRQTLRLTPTQAEQQFRDAPVLNSNAGQVLKRTRPATPSSMDLEVSEREMEEAPQPASPKIRSLKDTLRFSTGEVSALCELPDPPPASPPPAQSSTASAVHDEEPTSVEPDPDETASGTGTSPLPVVAEQIPTSEQQTPPPMQQPPSPVEEVSSTLVEQASTPVEQASTPVEQVFTPVEQASTPAEQVSTPADQASTPADQVSTPVEQASTPAEQASTPVEQVPVEQAPDPDHEQTTPDSGPQRDFRSTIRLSATEMMARISASQLHDRKQRPTTPESVQAAAPPSAVADPTPVPESSGLRKSDTQPGFPTPHGEESKDPLRYIRTTRRYAAVKAQLDVEDAPPEPTPLDPKLVSSVLRMDDQLMSRAEGRGDSRGYLAIKQEVREAGQEFRDDVGGNEEDEVEAENLLRDTIQDFSEKNGDLKMAAKSSRPFPLFSDLDTPAFLSMVDKLEHRPFENGTLIFQEGDPGDSLFLVSSGTLQVFKNDDKGRQIELARLGAGSFFGEFALLTDRRRHASVRALDDCELLELRRDVLIDMIDEHPSISWTLRIFYQQRLMAMVLATSPLFQAVQPEDRRTVLSRFAIRRLLKGEKIIDEGKPGTGFYVILVGEVSVSCMSKEGLEVPLGTLSEGDYFGEIALLTGSFAEASVCANQLTEVLMLNARDFYDLTSTHPEIWAEVQEEAERRQKDTANRVAGRLKVPNPVCLV